MINPTYVSYGSDPEIFFVDEGGRVIRAEKIIPKDGLPCGVNKSCVVIDGIQAELHPQPTASILSLGSQIASCMQSLNTHLTRFKGIKVHFGSVVEVTLAEIEALSEESRQLGCAPSRNVYGMKPINVDPLKYLKRSAGGHIHTGVGVNIMSPIKDERQRAIPLLDMFVGNTGVLLDRDPGAAERRKNYGRAGEFRFPNHGIEYRTLSNFWLRNYTVMDLMFGMANFAISVLNHSLMVRDIEREELLDTDLKSVVRAIQTNDPKLAWKNFQSLRGFIERWAGPDCPLNKTTIPNFERLVGAVNSDGLEGVFKTDPMTHWLTEAKVPFNQWRL